MRRSSFWMVGPEGRRTNRTRVSRLRLEPLEPRIVLSAASGLDNGPWPEHTEKDLQELTADWKSLADAGQRPDTVFDAGPLDGPQTYRGWVGWWDRRDVVRFELSAPSQVEIALRDLTADLDLLLYNRRGNRIAAAKEAGSRAEAIRETLEPGTFFLVVSPYRWSASPYTLSLDADAVRQPPAEGPPEPLNPEAPAARFPDVPYFGGTNEWNVNAVQAPEAWVQGFTGQDVTVAVVDTGIDLFHSDLIDNLWVNDDEIVGNGIDDDRNGYVDDVHGWDFADGDSVPLDGNGHGTHVAGTIAAGLNGFGATGIAPDATLLPVRVLGDNGSGSSLGVAAGIRYAADNGADIINLSLGGGYSSAIRSAIGYAGQQGSLVVAAAGNEAVAVPTYPARFSSQWSHVISVGAYAASGMAAPFSNHVGPSGAVQVDAPGVGVYNTFPGDRYARLSGTSMAAPHVSGLAALALSASPSLSPADLRSVIATGAVTGVVGSDARGAVNAATTVAWASANGAFQRAAGTISPGRDVLRSGVASLRAAGASGTVAGSTVRWNPPDLFAPLQQETQETLITPTTLDDSQRKTDVERSGSRAAAPIEVVFSRRTPERQVVTAATPSDVDTAAADVVFHQDPGAAWLDMLRGGV